MNPPCGANRLKTQNYGLHVKTRCVLTLLLAPLLLACGDQRTAEAVRFFQKANFVARQGEPREAIRLYTEAIEKKPDFADAYNNRGLVYQKNGSIENALADFTQALELEPDYWEAYYNRAQALADGGKYRESLADLSRLPKTYRDSAYVLVSTANAKSHLGDNAGALADYNLALLKNPSSAEALINRGYLFFGEKRYSQAGEDFRKALRLDSTQHPAYNNLALIEAQTGNFARALQLADEAVARKPGEAAYLNNRGYFLLRLNRLAEGKVAIESALRLNDANAWAWRNRGLYHLLTDHVQAALADLKKAESLDPSVESLYFYLGETYRRAKNQPEACRAYRKAQQLGDPAVTPERLNGCP